MNIRPEKKIQTSTNERLVLKICIIFLKILVIKTIEKATGMTGNRRVTKVFGAVNKKMFVRGKQ